MGRNLLRRLPPSFWVKSNLLCSQPTPRCYFEHTPLSRTAKKGVFFSRSSSPSARTPAIVLAERLTHQLRPTFPRAFHVTCSPPRRLPRQPFRVHTVRPLDFSRPSTRLTDTSSGSQRPPHASVRIEARRAASLRDPWKQFSPSSGGKFDCRCPYTPLSLIYAPLGCHRVLQNLDTRRQHPPPRRERVARGAALLVGRMLFATKRSQADLRVQLIFEVFVPGSNEPRELGLLPRCP